MGLEAVEIVMKVEETFDIVIEDSEAEKSVTPGMLIELVLSKVDLTSHTACPTQRAFHRLRASLISQSGFKRNQIRLDTLLASLFPRPTRKEKVREIMAGVGSRKEIEFVRPEWVHRLLLAMMSSGGIAITVFFAWYPISSKSLVMNVVFGSPIVPGVFSFVISGWLVFFATRWMRTEFRPSMTTVGHLSRWIVVNAPDVVSAPSGRWSREQVSEHIRQIVIDILGCEKEYREDAHFVKDLGLG